MPPVTPLHADPEIGIPNRGMLKPPRLQLRLRRALQVQLSLVCGSGLHSLNQKSISSVSFYRF